MAGQLAVLGSPISHSRSPALHLAAYRVLGLDWGYERIELLAAQLGAFLSGPGRTLLGVSATMPLKHELLQLSDWADPVARLSGAANTAIGMNHGQLRVFNTDVGGIVAALAEYGTTSARHAVLLGGGATAASALIALSQLGVETVELRLRAPRKAGMLLDIARELGVGVLVDQIDPQRSETPPEAAEVLISTLPAGAMDAWAADYAGIAPFLLDVAYEPWPSALAVSATERGAVTVSGLEMLLQQAVLQVRIFVNGDPLSPLPRESAVRAAMRAVLPA